MEGKVLKKSQNKIFCGVCGGLAEYLGVDYTIMRLIYAVLSICSAHCSMSHSGVLVAPQIPTFKVES